MAQAPLKKCANPSCRKLIRGASRCPDCAKQTNVRKAGPNDAFYQSKQWRDLRNAFIARNPLCAECEARGFTEPGRIVDHVVEMTDDPSKALDWSNLRVLCTSCHNRKTAIERHKRRGSQHPSSRNS